MDREELKELIQDVYDDYDFAEFNLHFVNNVEPGKVYEIKNNRINNKLKDTTLICSSGMFTNEQMETLKLYGVDVRDHMIREMIVQTADKILTDIYKVENKDWFHGRENIKIELTISNWQLFEEQDGSSYRYMLRFEVA